MTTFGPFTALFNIEGNAQERLRRLQGNMIGLNQSASGLGGSIADIGTRLRASFGAAPSREAIRLASSLEEVGRSGNFTAGSLSKVSREILFMSERIGGNLQPRLRMLSAELATLSGSMRNAEQQAQKTNVGMQMMGDVSDATGQRIRMMSSTMQGAMGVMSAMEGNVTGLAFSLIFLQFAGFLKLAAAGAVATVAVTLATKKFKEFLKNRKETEQFTDTLFALTGNVQAFEVAVQRAEQVVTDLGLATSGGLGKELKEGLEDLQVALRLEGLGPTSEQLELFTRVFLILKNRGQDFEEAYEGALATVIDFSKDGELAVDGVSKSMSNLVTESDRAFEALRKGTSAGLPDLIKIEDVIAAFSEMERPITKNLQKLLDGAVDGLIPLDDVLATAFPGTDLVSAFFETQFLETLTAAGVGAQTTSQTIQDAFKDINTEADASLGADGMQLIMANFVQFMRDNFVNGVLTNLDEVEAAWNALPEEVKRMLAGPGIEGPSIQFGPLFSGDPIDLTGEDLGTFAPLQISNDDILDFIELFQNTDLTNQEQRRALADLLSTFNSATQEWIEGISFLKDFFVPPFVPLDDVQVILPPEFFDPDPPPFLELPPGIEFTPGGGTLDPTTGSSPIINIFVDVSDNIVASDRDADRLAGVLSSSIIEKIQKGNSIGFVAGVPS